MGKEVLILDADIGMGNDDVLMGVMLGIVYMILYLTIKL